MAIDPLTASLILGWISHVGVEARPMSQYIIELSACGVNTDTASSLLPHPCPSICRPVIHAQQECGREARCICSKVSPTTLDSCIQCAISGLPPDHLLRTGVFIPSRINAYAEACGVTFSHRDYPVPSTNLTTSPTNVGVVAASSVPKRARDSSRALFTRELDDIRCIFGLPEVVGSRWPDISRATGIGPWPVLLFCAIAILCYAENRRSRSTSKAQR